MNPSLAFDPGGRRIWSEELRYRELGNGSTKVERRRKPKKMENGHNIIICDELPSSPPASTIVRLMPIDWKHHRRTHGAKDKYQRIVLRLRFSWQYGDEPRADYQDYCSQAYNIEQDLDTQKSSFGVVKDFNTFKKIQSLLGLDGYCEIEWKYYGGMQVIIIFDMPDIVNKFVVNKSLWQKIFCRIDLAYKCESELEQLA
ncbi:hypothetical protein LXL04_033484 [Taraxacum kok-saghyz]